MNDPGPFVLKTGLSDFYVEYQLNAHLAAAEQRVPVLSALHGHVVDVFNEHGVQILSPHYIADPEQPAVVPRDRWYAEPAEAFSGGGRVWNGERDRGARAQRGWRFDGARAAGGGAAGGAAAGAVNETPVPTPDAAEIR